MAITADKTALQFKMLNGAKGPGVRALRVQSDKLAYKRMMQDICLHQENLSVIEGMASRLNVTDNKVTGVTLKDGTVMNAKIVIVTTGTYMAGVNMISFRSYTRCQYYEQHRRLIRVFTRARIKNLQIKDRNTTEDPAFIH